MSGFSQQGKGREEIDAVNSIKVGRTDPGQQGAYHGAARDWRSGGNKWKAVEGRGIFWVEK